MGTSLTVLPQSAGMDLAAAERAAAAFLDALGATTPPATPGRMARAYAELLEPALVRPHHVPQRRGLRRARPRPRHPRAVGVRAPHAAVRRRRARRLPAGRAHPRAVQARPGRGAARAPPAGAGAAHHSRSPTGCTPPAPRGGRRGRGGRARVHDVARRAGRGHHHDHVRACGAPCATTRAPAPSSSPSPPEAAMADTSRSSGRGSRAPGPPRTLRAEGFDGPSCCSVPSRTSPTSGPRCPRATCRAPRRRRSCTRRSGTPSRTSTCASARGSPRSTRPRTRSRRPTATGSRYTKLLLTTGSSVRRLADAVTLRTLDDSDRLRAALRPGARVVIVGAGWIGLEVAAAARVAGAEVTVLEQAPAPLLAVLGPEMAAVFAQLHVEHGVDLRCGVTVARREVRRRAARRRRPCLPIWSSRASA